MCPVKILIRLHKYAGSSGSSLDAHVSEDAFSYIVAHVMVVNSLHAGLFCILFCFVFFLFCFFLN